MVPYRFLVVDLNTWATLNRNLRRRTSTEEHIASDCGILHVVMQVGLDDVQVSARTVDRGISIVAALGEFYPNQHLPSLKPYTFLFYRKNAYSFLGCWLCCLLDWLRSP